MAFHFFKAAQILSTHPTRYSPLQADQKKPNWVGCRRVENKNTVTVNWIRVALKVTAGYISAATVCFILIIKQQKTNSKP